MSLSATTHRRNFAAGLWTASLLLLTSAAGAQEMPRPPDLNRVRVRAGALFISPTLSLTNLGVDTNVFNEPDSETPEKDVTIAVTPAADLWLRMGRTWMVGNVKEDLIWFNEFESQRSANGNYTATWLVPFNRLTFAVGGNWIFAKERPGFEIDARVDRTEQSGNGIVEIRPLSKTFVGVRGERRKIEFAEGEAFLGTDLPTELNRTVTTLAATIRNELTPLTSITFAVGRTEERFHLSPLRDADSTLVDVGVRFDPFALISGSATVGYRHFKPLSPDIPGYSGSTIAASLSYTALGSIRISGTVDRDIEYSYDASQPHYLLSGFSVSLAQQIYGPLDVQVRGGAQRLEYSDREGAPVAVANRVDHVRSYGGGVGYRLGQDLRLGFNVDNARRRSELDTRQYQGLRYGLAVTYGL